jgi:D-alanine-D-alanine ligase-like ATP-grasp enzyme
MERLETISQPVLIEKFLRGREITLGVLGNENARTLPPLEIVYRKGDITLTFEKKELDNDSFLCPAPLTAKETQMMQQLVGGEHVRGVDVHAQGKTSQLYWLHGSRGRKGRQGSAG